MIDFDTFARHLAAQDKSAHTIKGYLADLRAFQHWFEQAFGHPLTLEGVMALDVRQYRQHLQTTQNSTPATINRRLSAIRTWCKWGMQQGIITINPLDAVQGVASQESAPHWLTAHDQRALLRQAALNRNAAGTTTGKLQTQRDELILLLLLNTGLRVSELCDLQVGDLTINERKGNLRVRNGKGGKARTIPLNKVCRQALVDWLTQNTGQLLFEGKQGDALQPRGVERMIASLGRQAGVAVTPHQLRHTFAKNLINAGVTLEKVAMLLGHSNLNTTRIYITPSQADLAAAVGLLGG